MRSVFFHLIDVTRESIAARLPSLAHPNGGAYLPTGTPEPVLFLAFYNDLLIEAEPTELKALEASLGRLPDVTVVADVSGRVPGDKDVRQFAELLLNEFRGVAWDDYTDHCWTLHEIQTDAKVEGHSFFDYEGWYREDCDRKMNFTILEPEVAGGWGPRTIANVSVHPPVVSRLHFECAGWLGDDLLESFPCFVASDRLAHALRQSSLTGFVLDEVEVTTSPEFDEQSAGKKLPGFLWLKISGRGGFDDFGLSNDHRLVASPEAMNLLGEFKIKHADQSPYKTSG